ncbi:MAG: DUF2914 domain-containing protein [Methylococcaceae bacterium]|nr:DUF2914 domain-containing protein [Methylococcaceae bacterium]
MSEKKLVIKLKYGASALPEKRSSPVHRPPEYDWNYIRIAALGIGLIILTLLAYSLLGKSGDQEAADQPIAVMRPDENPSIKESVPRENSPIVVEIPSNEVKPETGLAKGAASPVEARVEAPVQAESKPIVRASFAWGIQNKEPTGAISSPAILQPGDSVTIYFFSAFEQLNGQTISHEWSHNGRVTHIRNFQIRADRWRVFSSKHLNSERLGEWKVTIRNSDGKILGEYVLNVLKPAKRPI